MVAPSQVLHRVEAVPKVVLPGVADNLHTVRADCMLAVVVGIQKVRSSVLAAHKGWPLRVLVERTGWPMRVLVARKDWPPRE